jgi:excisionase family DNA binding protein
MDSHDVALTIALAHDQFEALARRVAALIEEGRDDGFLGEEGAAQYLSTTPKAIYHLVERRRLPRYRPDGRLLFDRAELRAYVEGGR